VPLPLIALVTSTLVHTPAANAPEEAITLPFAGAEFQLTVCSLQAPDTGRTSNPADELLAEYTCKVAFNTDPDTLATPKRSKLHVDGDPSARNNGDDP
jgi:hypothetical protein